MGTSDAPITLKSDESVVRERQGSMGEATNLRLGLRVKVEGGEATLVKREVDIVENGDEAAGAAAVVAAEAVAGAAAAIRENLEESAGSESAGSRVATLSTTETGRLVNDLNVDRRSDDVTETPTVRDGVRVADSIGGDITPAQSNSTNVHVNGNHSNDLAAGARSACERTNDNPVQSDAAAGTSVQSAGPSSATPAVNAAGLAINDSIKFFYFARHLFQSQIKSMSGPSPDCRGVLNAFGVGEKEDARDQLTKVISHWRAQASERKNWAKTQVERNTDDEERSRLDWELSYRKLCFETANFLMQSVKRADTLTKKDAEARKLRSATGGAPDVVGESSANIIREEEVRVTDDEDKRRREEQDKRRREEEEEDKRRREEEVDKRRREEEVIRCEGDKRRQYEERDRVRRGESLMVAGVEDVWASEIVRRRKEAEAMTKEAEAMTTTITAAQGADVNGRKRVGDPIDAPQTFKSASVDQQPRNPLSSSHIASMERQLNAIVATTIAATPATDTSSASDQYIGAENARRLQQVEMQQQLQHHSSHYLLQEQYAQLQRQQQQQLLLQQQQRLRSQQQFYSQQSSQQHQDSIRHSNATLQIPTTSSVRLPQPGVAPATAAPVCSTVRNTGVNAQNSAAFTAAAHLARGPINLQHHLNAPMANNPQMTNSNHAFVAPAFTQENSYFQAQRIRPSKKV